MTKRDVKRNLGPGGSVRFFRGVCGAQDAPVITSVSTDEVTRGRTCCGRASRLDCCTFTNAEEFPGHSGKVSSPRYLSVVTPRGNLRRGLSVVVTIYDALEGIHSTPLHLQSRESRREIEDTINDNFWAV
ncbi:unnamed protein product [Scytosiphon promiscuus]